MKLALGMIVYNDSKMLEKLLHLHIHAFDGVIAVDSGSTDNSIEVLCKHGAQWVFQPWQDFSVARNVCIEWAKIAGYDQIFFLDCDESLLFDDVKIIRSLAETHKVLAFPRLEFIESPEFINSIFYPDIHVRCFPLNGEFHYRGKIHEVLFHGNSQQNVLQTAEAVKIPYIHVYHYGKLKPASEIQLKYQNMDRTAHGEPRQPVITGELIPSFSQGPKVRFYGRQPLCI